MQLTNAVSPPLDEATPFGGVDVGVGVDDQLPHVTLTLQTDEVVLEQVCLGKESVSLSQECKDTQAKALVACVSNNFE